MKGGRNSQVAVNPMRFSEVVGVDQQEGRGVLVAGRL